MEKRPYCQRPSGSPALDIMTMATIYGLIFLICLIGRPTHIIIQEAKLGHGVHLQRANSIP